MSPTREELLLTLAERSAGVAGQLANGSKSKDSTVQHQDPLRFTGPL